MNWYLANPNAEDTVKALEASGQTIPVSLYPPRVFGGYESWLEAFWDLGTDRDQVEGRVGPIPRSAVRRYEENMDPEEFDIFWSIVRKMDSAYMQFIRNGVTTTQSFTRDMFKSGLGKGRRTNA